MKPEPQPPGQEDSPARLVTPFDDRVDETLVDEMLAQTISDRLRSLCHYANALARLRSV